MAQVRTVVVGTGGFGRFHIRRMLQQRSTTRIVALVEVDETSREKTRALFAEFETPCPPFFETLGEAVRQTGRIEAALIATPHKYHLENVCDALRAGMDVLVEKPMVLNADEARRVIRLRDRMRRVVVVGFPGSLSPAVRKAKGMIGRGALGTVTAINAYVHQRWKKNTTGKWRQDPEISGGGFLFDTGSHMVNTVVDLAGEDVAEVAAVFDNRGTPVEINAAVSGRFVGGAEFAMMAAGDSIQCCSEVVVIGDRGVLKTGIWGERLLFRKEGDADFSPVPYGSSKGVWEQFLKVRAGRMENPCPAEVGLRFARLMDMIRASAASGRLVRASRRR